MKKFQILLALDQIGRARVAWAEAHTSFRADVDTLMKRLINEAAVNYMSAEDVAKASGFPVKRVRALMRANNLNPKNGKRLLAKTAAATLEENAALLGVEPRDFDLMSPLAYLPMGSNLRSFLGNSVTADDLNAIETEAIYHETKALEFEALADTIYNAMPWEGETYQAAAEALANAVLAGGWTHVGVNA